MTEKTFGIRGFPQKCVCGGEVTIYTAKTQDNPGRPFFRCVTRKEEHLFKWVEEGVYEELVDVLPKFRAVESDMSSAKYDLEDMKSVMEEMMEEVVRSKKAIGICNMMMVMCVGFLCIIIIVMAMMIMSGKARN